MQSDFFLRVNMHRSGRVCVYGRIKTPGPSGYTVPTSLRSGQSYNRVVRLEKSVVAAVGSRSTDR